MYKHWTNTIREQFPYAEIRDSALVYPIRARGWNIDVPMISLECDFANPAYHLFVNLQDMLTGKELIKLHKHFTQGGFPLNRITVIVWPKGIKQILPENSFNVIELSSHQYETWCSYKTNEDVLRDAFSQNKKDFEYNFVCPQRIYKLHRAAIYSTLNKHSHANVSLQSKGHELAYPSLSFNEYELKYDNLVNLLAMKKNYNTALFSIISESQYVEKYGIITEKTFNSIVAGMPFTVAAHQGALANISDYGFMTYPGLFDETYDGLDNQVRIKDMIKSNSVLIEEPLSLVEMKHIYEECSGIIEYNRNYFFDQFGDQLISELRLDLLNIWGQ